MPSGGHNRKPKSRKIIEGTFRADRNPGKEPEPPAVEVVPRPPAYMGRHGKRLWKKLAPLLMDQGILTEVDLSTLELCCESYDVFRSAHEAVYRTVDPMTGRKVRRSLADYFAGRNSQTAPEYAAMKGAWQTYKSYMAEFGLSPVARNRIDLPEPKKDNVDPMEALLNGG